MNTLQDTGDWFARNQDWLLELAVNIAFALLIFLAGLIVGSLVSRGIRRLSRSRGFDTTITDFLAALARYAILAFALVAALNQLGVQTASVIAILGAAGLAVGLALQGSLSNFAAGVLLVAFRPLRAGESVDLGGVAGAVIQVQLFSTTLLTGDNHIIVVPNGKIIAGNIVNYSREPLRRVEIKLSLPNSADIDAVKRVLGGVLAAQERILKEREMTVRLNEITPGAQIFVIRAWVRNADHAGVQFDLMESFKRAIDANQWGFGRSQMDVFLQK
jgi:small conductance mechanosensitive channel